MPASRPAAPSGPNGNGELVDRTRAYSFHGVQLSRPMNGGHAVGQCPFCSREGKFSVDVQTGLWRCFVCAAGTQRGGGNGLVFTRLIWEQADQLGAGVTKSLAGPRGALGGPRMAELGGSRPVGHSGGLAFLGAVSADRGLISPETPRAWGVREALDGSWLVPGYGTDGKLDQVYRRTRVKDSAGNWTWRLLPTPGIWPEGKAHALHLPVVGQDFDPARPDIIVCEGPWDALALWELWDRTTTTPPHNTNIIAVPGCGVWRDEWTALCRGKNVTLLYDSDHPPARAGYLGMARVCKRLSGIARTVRCISWGPDGYDPALPSGYDVRDHLVSYGIDLHNRRIALASLLSKVQDAPRDWFLPHHSITSAANGSAVSTTPHHEKSTEALPCASYSICEAAWIDAMQWRRDLADALSVVLAICASTQQGGNQLFLQLVGSAGGGKTTILDGLLVSGHCHHLEHLTGFYSGWKMQGDGDKDCSLIARINGKTLITPEADVLMSDPNFDRIMGQQRRIFDGKAGASYRNTDEDRLYVCLRTPWIMAGTPVMMDQTARHQSHLGDRFLRFIISDPPADERRAIIRKALRSERVAMLETVNGTAGSVVDPKTRLAHALTGGYVDWLRANVEDNLSTIQVSEAAEDYCIDLAELSADLRARPNEDSRKLETHDSKELPTRLARQNIRLASCLAVVLNRREVDADILRIVRKVALDTASGPPCSIAQWLCSRNQRDPNNRNYQECGGISAKTLAVWLSMTPERTEKYLCFMRNIGVLQLGSTEQTGGLWSLTDRSYDLFLRIMR